MPANYCSNCGNAVPEGAKFCPACGHAPGTPVVVHPSKRTYFIWVPIALVALVLLAWAVLSGMPFGGEDRRQPPQVRRDTPVIQEPVRNVPTGTVARIGEPITPTRAAPPPPRPASKPAPAHVVVVEEKRISEEEAVSLLHSFISERGDVSSSCLVLMSEGLRNVGYTVAARDRCENKSAGRWRVDAKTREIFRQNASGRYVRP